MSLAEKFQITVPAKIEAGADFVSFESAQVKRAQGRSEDGKFNNMPSVDLRDPGGPGFVQGFGGDTDVSGGVSGESMARGFNRNAMQGTDDQYGGEHIDLFYGEVVDEKGNVGFAERNNYLDRI